MMSLKVAPSRRACNDRNSFPRILTANDVYRPERFSAMKALKSKHKGIGTTICVFPGDFLGGSLFAVSTRGVSMLEVCNEVGFDYVTIGNHEFDYGSDDLETLIDMSNFKWLGSNIRYSENGQIFHGVKDYDIIELPCQQSLLDSEDYDSQRCVIRVGIFGVCTEETPTLSSPSDKVLFEGTIDHAQRLAKHLKGDMNCDIVIAMTHVSLEQDKRIVEVGGIDAVLGGHDHEPYILEHRDVLIMKCGQNLDYLGILDFSIECEFKCDDDSKRDLTVHRSLQLISTYDAPTDAAVNEVIGKWKVLSRVASAELNGNMDMDEVLSIVDPDSDVSLSTKTSDCRLRETAFCCILADALKWAFNNETDESCDFAIQNGGFVRADRVYAPGTAITRAIIAEELPFRRFPVLLGMTGSKVLLALEQMLPETPSPQPTGSYPQLSDGVSATFDLSYAKNGRPKITNLKVKGEPIDLNRVYKVATQSFYYYESGDGVTAFHDSTLLKEDSTVISEVLMNYLKTQSSISGKLPCRLVPIDE